jgi:tetratricopeptide (TPR) repeat protein
MKLLEADFLSAEGVLDWKLGNLALAMPKLEAALEIQTEAREWVTMASISNNLGIIAYSLKDYGKAADHYRQGLDWLETHENDRLRASLYSNLAEVLIPVGELDEAEKYLSLALVIEEQSQEPRSLAYTYFNLGELKAGRGQSEEAILLYKKALALQIQVEDEWAAALTRLKHATELWKLGKMKNALEELEEGYATAQSLYALSLLRDYCSTMAGIHSELGNSGLQSYYSDLETNFSRRVQLEESPESAQAPLASTIDAGGISQEKALFSPLQAATVVLLCLLITTLAMEIARLRKRMKDI